MALKGGNRQAQLPTYTFSVLMVFPLARATHSPVPVECPVFIVMPWMSGDQAMLVIWLAAVYAMIGSVTTRFFTSGLGEFKRAPELRGEAPVWV